MRSRSALLGVLLVASPAFARGRSSILATASIDGDAWIASGRVYVDGVRASDLVDEEGTWESLPLDVDAGRHVVRVELDDGRTEQRTVTVADGERSRVRVHFGPLVGASTSTPTSTSATPTKPHGPAWGFLFPLGWGVAFTSISIAAVVDSYDTHLKAVSFQEGANIQSPGICTSPSTSSSNLACAKSAKLESKAETGEVVGGIFMSIGAGAIAGSIVALVLSSRAARHAKTAWNVTPWVSPQLMGLGLVARF